MGWGDNDGKNPWGDSGGRKDPPNPWGKRPSGGGSDQEPPDIEDMIKSAWSKISRTLGLDATGKGFGGGKPGRPGGLGGGGLNKRLIGLGLAGVVALWTATGFYIVRPDQVGVVLRFGRFDRLAAPGLNYHLPSPIERVALPSVTAVNQIQLGFRSGGAEQGLPSSALGTARSVPRAASDESLMLTGDENIVDITFSVFWKINDPEKFLFNIRNPENTVRVVAESSMREIIGQLPIRAPLFENRQPIVDRTRARMQELLDKYKSGISIEQVQLLKSDPPQQVIDAFNDVQRARTDLERSRNEAEVYRNDILPRARGEAQKIVQDAEAYKEKVIAQAQGDARRFTSVWQAYKTAPDLTARRLYLETVEQLLKDAPKMVLDPQVKSATQAYLPLPALPDAGRPAPRPEAKADPKKSASSAPNSGATP